MDTLTVAGLTAGALVLIFSLLRVEPKRRWVAVVFLVAPVMLLIIAWSRYGHWPETLLSFGLAGLIAGVWWLAYGRRLPPASSDGIKVWGQETAPRPKPAELQAEVQRLRMEKEKLETELRRLREGPAAAPDEGSMTTDDRQ